MGHLVKQDQGQSPLPEQAGASLGTVVSLLSGPRLGTSSCPSPPIRSPILGENHHGAAPQGMVSYGTEIREGCFPQITLPEDYPCFG